MSYSIVCNLSKLSEQELNGKCVLVDHMTPHNNIKLDDLTSWNDLFNSNEINSFCTSSNNCNVQFNYNVSPDKVCTFSALEQGTMLSGICDKKIMNNWVDFNNMLINMQQQEQMLPQQQEQMLPQQMLPQQQEQMLPQQMLPQQQEQIEQYLKNLTEEQRQQLIA